jgi:hypothetical protein
MKTPLNISEQSLISCPVGVLTKQSFRHQAALFWHAHRQVYGGGASTRTKILWVENNLATEPRVKDLAWLHELGAPYLIAKPYYEIFDCPSHGVNVPLNIQAAVAQIIDQFHPDQVIEILDCDMFHLRKAPVFQVADDEILVDSIYESWHLHSLGKHRDVIAKYFKHGGDFYNGGFVPIIGRAKTIKKILEAWVEIHIDIVKRDFSDKIKWWAGMFALQAACENTQVRMIGINATYIPGKNELALNHYIAHYSVDKFFDKKNPAWPYLKTSDFPQNRYYDCIRGWMQAKETDQDTFQKSDQEKAQALDPRQDAKSPVVMEDKWKHWIAKCLLMEHADASIVANLAAKGYSEHFVEEEIKKAKSDPYFKGARDVFAREKSKLEVTKFEQIKALKNSAWLLKTYEKLSRMDNSFGEIERISVPPFKEFVSKYLSRNRPVILKAAMEDWPAYKKWSLEYFQQVHGTATVSIQDGRDADPHYERNQKFFRKEVIFSDFIERLKQTESSNDFYMTAGNMAQHIESLPEIFADSDAVNIGDGYLTGQTEGSLWIGPKGTITPLHFDMVNNLFCQIRGRKQVRLVPSWSLPWVYNDYHVYSDVDAARPDFDKHPLFENATVYDFVVNAGEVLFIPIGWWHHLESLDMSISLTRKNLALPASNSFGAGFIKESTNFSVGKLD